MSEFGEIPLNIERVFKPGNLVWGTHGVDKTRFESLATKGILPGDYFGRPGIRPYNVCFAMLDNSEWKVKFGTRENIEPFMARYFKACHSGPTKSNEGRPVLKHPYFDLSIIADRSELLSSFKGRIFAIGDNFRDTFHRANYDIKDGDKAVYGIPISHARPYTEDPWLDEVVIEYFGENRENPRGVTPTMWTGIVTGSENFEVIGGWLREFRIVDVLVFSPEGNILIS